MPLPYPPFKSCPCGSGRSYSVCCQPAHDGTRPPQSPENLMRARYSAFFLQNEAFVLATWHPRTRPSDLTLTDGTRYTGLKIHEAVGDEVEFTVSMKLPGGQPHRFRERSRFEQVVGEQGEGVWVYVDGDVIVNG